MNVVGIIAEYNPMHNGHIYHINRAKERSHADYAIVIISGSFTQQGNIATIDKFSRAEIAIQNGADLVIELPTIYSISSAENFAYSAVKILNSLGVVTHLAFGAELNDICKLEDVAKTYLNNKDEIITKSKIYLKDGISSAKAYNKALDTFLEANNTPKSLPNNILAIEYLKALIILESQIKPVLIERLSSNHSDNNFDLNSQFASSTAIRNILANNSFKLSEKLTQIQQFVPSNVYDYLSHNDFNTNEHIWNNLKYEITKLKPNRSKKYS